MNLETKCKKHWGKIGINNLENLQKHIKAIFQKHDHQKKVLTDIYKLVFPDWDQIKMIEGYPEAGFELWKYIWNLFIEFDRKHHPNCFKGGAWMNTGFSANKDLSLWAISFSNCEVTMN